MVKTEQLFSISKILCLLAVVSVVFTGITFAQVAVDGEFDGTMVGYGQEANEGAGDAPNEITVEGSFTVEGEPIENVEIDITSGEYTVLDTSSLQLRVPGEGIEFSTSAGPDRLTASTGELPEDTEVELTFIVYYIGETDNTIENDSIDAARINVNYRTLGGSQGDQSFSADTDVSNRAESEIASLERGDQIGTVQEVLSYVGGLAVVLFVLYIFIALVNRVGGNGKSGKPPT